MDELYFCLRLTEFEHLLAEGSIRHWADICGGVEVRYYRKLKDGHVPMYREVKLTGQREQLNRFEAWMRSEKFDKHVEQNPHKA